MWGYLCCLPAHEHISLMRGDAHSSHIADLEGLADNVAEYRFVGRVRNAFFARSALPPHIAHFLEMSRRKVKIEVVKCVSSVRMQGRRYGNPRSIR